MKKIATLLMFFCSTLALKSQPGIQWEKCLGGYDLDEAYGMDRTPDGGIIVVGSTYSNDEFVLGQHGAWDGWIVKLNADGEIQWQRTIGGTLNDILTKVCTTADGGYILSGFAESTDGDIIPTNAFMEAMVLKLDANGATEWMKMLGGNYNDYAFDIQQDTDGGYIVGAQSNSSDGDLSQNHGVQDAWLVKLSPTGDILWQKSYGGSSDDGFLSIRTTSDGGYIACGETYSSDGDVSGQHGETDIWVVKINQQGDIQWQKAIGGSDRESAGAVIQANDGGYVMVGGTYSFDGNSFGNHGTQDAIVVKFKENGTIEWKKPLGGISYETGISLCKSNDGGYVLGGYSSTENGVEAPDGANYWIVKLSETGTVLWQERIGGSLYEGGVSAIVQTQDGGYGLAGFTQSTDGDVTNNHGAYDMWIVKLEPEAVGVPNGPLSFEAEPLSIFPNPAQQYASFSIPEEEGMLKIRFLDRLGRTALCQFLQNGTPLDVVALASGLYEVEARSSTGKMYRSKFTKL